MSVGSLGGTQPQAAPNPAPSARVLQPGEAPSGPGKADLLGVATVSHSSGQATPHGRAGHA
jgi:hypothetical protein